MAQGEGSTQHSVINPVIISRDTRAMVVIKACIHNLLSIPVNVLAIALPPLSPSQP